MKLLLRYSTCALIALFVASPALAEDVSGWEFSWDLEREKERHRPDIEYYTEKADGHLAKGNFWRARYYYKKLYKKSRSLHNRGNAKLAIAVAHYGSNNYRTASKEIREAVSGYANFIPFQKALALEFRLAREHFHGKRDFLRSSLSDEAIEIYKHIQDVAPFSPFSEKAVYNAGLLEVEAKNLNGATVLFTKLINRYPKSIYKTNARLELIHALLRMARVAEGDPMLEKRAKSEIMALAATTLTDEQAQRLKTLVTLADDISTRYLLFLGEFYQRRSHWNPEISRRYLEEIITNYKSHPRASQAEFLLAKLPAQSESKETKK